MATTTNYSWTTPDDTDLVKDGAAAIRTLGTAIDTTVFTNAGAAVAKATVDAKGDLIVGTANDTVARLAVGANGTTLVADSSTATGLAYRADTVNTLVDAEGDLIVGDAPDTVQRLAVGSNGQILTVDTSVDGKIKWATPGGGGDFIKIASGTFSGASSVTVNDVFSATYDYYKLIITVTGSTGGVTNLRYRVSGTDATGTNYRFQRLYAQSSTVGTLNSASQNKVAVVGTESTAETVGEVLIANPFLAKPTRTIASNTYDDKAFIDFYMGRHSLSTSYTGFTMLPDSGTITGDYILYGLKA